MIEREKRAILLGNFERVGDKRRSVSGRCEALVDAPQTSVSKLTLQRQNLHDKKLR